jgi:hypothetical protein
MNRSNVMLLSFFNLFLLLFLCVILVTFRDLYHGDTLNYIEYFERNVILGGVPDTRFEPLFVALTYVCSIISEDYRFFLFIVATLTICSTAWGAKNIHNYCSSPNSSLLYLYLWGTFGFLFLSSWYFSALTNGLRQGLSLSFLFLSLSFFLNQRFFFFFVFSFIAISFHYSSAAFVLVPIFFSRFNLSVCCSIFVVSIVAYYFDFFGMLFLFASNLLGIPFYTIINKFSEDALWVGFQLNFVLYNFLHFIFILFLYRYVVSTDGKEKCAALLKMFIGYSVVYFVLGFGGYSNRLGFISWLFLFYLYPCVFPLLKIVPWQRNILVFLVPFFGVLSFCYKILFTSYH